MDDGIKTRAPTPIALPTIETTRARSKVSEKRALDYCPAIYTRYPARSELGRAWICLDFLTQSPNMDPPIELGVRGFGGPVSVNPCLAARVSGPIKLLSVIRVGPLAAPGA